MVYVKCKEGKKPVRVKKRTHLKGGRREISNPEITGASEEDRDKAGESKDGADPGRNSSKGVKLQSYPNATLDSEGIEEDRDKASATTFSRPEM